MKIRQLIGLAAAAFLSCAVPQGAQAQALVTQPTTVQALGAALKYDPNLIYEYVHNNVQFEVDWGLRKGALGALLTGYGTAWDQADLMVQAINAGFPQQPAVYEMGLLTLTPAQVAAWTGIPTTNVCVVASFFNKTGLGVQAIAPSAASCPASTADAPNANLTAFNGVALTSLTVPHVWVKAYVNGQWQYFDPTFKTYTVKSPMALATITGYTSTGFMTAAKSGATIATTSVKNLNRTNIQSQLTSYAGNLISNLRVNAPQATLSDVVGGRGDVVKVSGGDYGVTVMPSAMYSNQAPMQIAPAQDAAPPTDCAPQGTFPTTVTNLEYTSAPYCYQPALVVEYQDSAGNNYFPPSLVRPAQLYTLPLLLSFNKKANGRMTPVLQRGSQVIETTTSDFATGTAGVVSLWVYLPQFATSYDNAHRIIINGNVTAGGGTYLIANGWGREGRSLINFYQKQASDSMAAGNAADSIPVVGYSLSALAAAYNTQFNDVVDLVGRMSATGINSPYQIGLAGRLKSVSGSGASYSYVDLAGLSLAYQSFDGTVPTLNAAAQTIAGRLSSLESTVVQQMTGIAAQSTTKLIDAAISKGLTIYNAAPKTTVPALDASCGTATVGDKHDIQYLVTGDSTKTPAVPAQRVIFPQTCNLGDTGASWAGAGYEAIHTGSSGEGTGYGMLISGGYSGGYGDAEQSDEDFLSEEFVALPSPVDLNDYEESYSGDPVDTAKGSFVQANDDISVGVGKFPQKLTFTRTYTSAQATTAKTLGYGWDHNFDIQATIGSDGFLAQGENSAIDAAATIVQLQASLGILNYADFATVPTENILASLVAANWSGSQMMNNTVAVQRGLDAEVFVQLPDGSYHQPPGSSSRLTAVKANGVVTGYVYDNVHHGAFHFNCASAATACTASTYTEPSGIQVSFAYDAKSRLSTITNSLGRSLTLSYDDATGYLKQVTGGLNGTNYYSVGYDYDSAGNLTGFTNANLASTTYGYTSSLGKGYLSAIYPAAHPNSALVSNQYDALGRVQFQTNSQNGRTTYYFAGSRSEEDTPTDGAKVSYLDNAGRVVQAINPLGNSTTTVYDNAGRISTTTLPEGNSTQYVYDDASCGAAADGFRCTQNIKTKTQVPKPGSALPSIVESYAYETSFNNLQTSKDGNGNITQMSYRPSDGQPSVMTLPADKHGVQGTTTYDYTAYTPSNGMPSFNMPTSKTVLIQAGSPGRSTKSTTTYDATNGYVPLTSTVDAGTGTALNYQTTYGYGPTGDLTSRLGPVAGQSVTNVYDAEHHVTSTIDTGETDYFYDADGKPLRTAVIVHAGASGTLLLTCHTYSTSDQVTAEWGPVLLQSTAQAAACPAQAAPAKVTTYSYDSQDRLSQTTEFLAEAQGGNRVTEQDYYLDDSVQYVLKAVGTTLEQIYQTNTYTDNGKLETVADARDNLTTYTYDGFDRPDHVYYPSKTNAASSSTTDFEYYAAYDANGNVKSFNRRNGQNVAQTFDNLNRVITRTSADSFTYDYDLVNHPLTVTSSGGAYTVTKTYDNAGCMLADQQGSSTMSYACDAAGNVLKITWPDGFYVTRQYDAKNRLTNVYENGASTLLATYNYDGSGTRTSVAFANSTSTVYGRDNQWMLNGLQQKFLNASASVQFTYGRDQVGDILTHQWDNSRYQWLNYGGTTAYASANGLNQYTTIGSASVTYDDNGNLSGDGTWSYGYNRDNQLTSASGAGNSATLTYDANGRLRQVAYGGGTTTNWLYSGNTLMAEVDTSGNILRRFVPGAAQDEPLVWYEGSGTAAGNKSWLYTDHVGSVIATADSSGNGGAAFTYGPYGEPDSTNGLRLRYAGKPMLNLGVSGLYVNQARIYSPALGRFLQTDPTGYKDHMNLYAYAANNPVNWRDPRGTNKTEADDIDESLVGSPSQLVRGQADERTQLAQIGSDGKVGFSPSADDVNSVAFNVIVGDPKYTASGDLRGTIFDGSNDDGVFEIKTGSSTLDSSYQLRLQVYASVTSGTPFTLYTSRPINSTFADYLDNWGVDVQPLKGNGP